VLTAFSEYGEVVTVSLRKKGGEFDTKNWALVTFSEPEAAGRALFSEVSDHWSHPHCESAAPAPRSPV
jgi:RNA recognition motif-containing protein